GRACRPWLSAGGRLEGPRRGRSAGCVSEGGSDVSADVAVQPLVHPLAGDMNEYRLAGPALMVIFGATGGLSGRKLLPAMFNLARNRLLPAGFALVGAALDELREEKFREWAGEHIKEHSRTQPVDAHSLEAFLSDLTYMPIDFSHAEGFQRLSQSLSDLD